MKIKKSTNVLSFPNDDSQKDKSRFLGEIFLAYETCIKEAKKLNIKNIHRIAHLIVHGTLHLLGFDHINNKDYFRMKKIEKNILNSFA